MNDQSAPAPRKQPIIILTTPRLILRTATDQDIPVMRERVLGDGDVMRYVFQGGPMSNERAEEVMRKHFTFGEKLTGNVLVAVNSGKSQIRDRFGKDCSRQQIQANYDEESSEKDRQHCLCVRKAGGQQGQGDRLKQFVTRSSDRQFWIVRPYRGKHDHQQ